MHLALGLGSECPASHHRALRLCHPGVGHVSEVSCGWWHRSTNTQSLWREGLAVFPTDSCCPCGLSLWGCSRRGAQGLPPPGSMGGPIFFCVFQSVPV